MVPSDKMEACARQIRRLKGLVLARHSYSCIDAHTCGNPVRVVVGGAPVLPHASMADRRDAFLREFDWVRRALMFEPRGHDVMSGSILYPSIREDCELGVLFIEVSGCLPMCGHGTIGTVTVAIEEGLVTPRREGRIAIETPAGRVDVEYEMDGAEVAKVRLFNVASFLHTSEVRLDVPEIGKLVIDLAYGGNFYAIVEPQPSWRGLDTTSALDILLAQPTGQESRSGSAGAGPSFGAPHPRRQSCHVVRQAAECARRRPQRRVLRREGDRSIAVWNRLFRAHGATVRERPSRGGRRFRARKPDRHNVRLSN